MLRNHHILMYYFTSRKSYSTLGTAVYRARLIPDANEMSQEVSMIWSTAKIFLALLNFIVLMLFKIPFHKFDMNILV